MIISHIIAAFQRWRMYNATVSELAQLSDRQLADLGISRCDITQIAREAAAQH